MCIPHGTTIYQPDHVVKDDRQKKHIQKPSKEMYEKGDPDFVDERKKPYIPKKEKSFFSTFFK